MKSRMISLGLIFCFSAFSVPAADWPQWRGPERSGVSKESGLLKQWPAGGPKLLWQVNELGDGYSTPVVVGSRIYLMSNQGLDNEFVQALSTEDGKVIWTTRVGNVGNPNQNPPYPNARSTPTIDGDLFYAADGHLYLHLLTGDFILVEATPQGFREKGRFTPPNPPKHKQICPYPEAAFAYPVIANGRLYIRDLGTLWAYDIKEKR